MATFADLTDAPRLVREYGIEAERSLEHAPLQALLRARQAFEKHLGAERNDTSLSSEGWSGEFENVLHGRLGRLCIASERKAAAKALHFVFDRAKPQGSRMKWTHPSFKGGRDTFSQLQLEHDSLLDLVDSKDTPSKEEIEGLVVKLRKRSTRLRKEGDLEAVEVDLLALMRALIEAASEGHSGGVRVEPEPEVAQLLERADEASGELWRLAVHHQIRRAIILTNDFRFEPALDILQGIIAPHGEEAVLKDDLMGRALGTAGQAAGFVARTLRDPDYVHFALEYFDAAAKAFSLPADVERQRTYRVHALCEGVILGRKDLKAELLAEIEAVTPRVDAWLRRRTSGPQIDYALAVWLKAHHVLRRPVERHAQISEAWSELPGRTTPDGQIHGPLLVVGWLGVTVPPKQGGVPRRLRKCVSEVAETTEGPLRFIARAFQCHFEWRSGEPFDLSRLSSAVPLTDGAQQWWATEGFGAWIEEQCRTEESYGPIVAVPFNHA